jgi:hypothetical protein
MTDLAGEADMLKLCGAVEEAFLDAGVVPRPHRPPPPAKVSPPRPLELGSLVVLEGDPISTVTIRVVVGKRRDGRVVSTLVKPPPWLLGKSDFRADLVSELRLLNGDEHRFRAQCRSCPIRHGCMFSETNEPIPDERCFLRDCLRPKEGN